MTTVVSLGSNLGDRLTHLTSALAALRVEFLVQAVSPVYETAPIGGPAGQQAYLNAIVLLDTLDAETVLAAGQRAEHAAGRMRGERWGPRPLDVDVIVAGGRTSQDPVLTLPHPRAHERAFVVLPWLDVAPDAEIPGHGLLRDLAPAVRDQGVRRTDLALA